MTQKKIAAIWAIPIVIFGIAIGFIANSTTLFQFKNEINFISLLTLIVTSTLGVYIALTLKKNTEAEKFEKNLILQNIDSIKKIILSIEVNLSEEYLNFRTVTKRFSDISKLLTELEEYNEICKLIDPGKIKNLRESLFLSKRKITGVGRKYEEKLIHKKEENMSAREQIKASNKMLKKFLIYLVRA